MDLVQEEDRALTVCAEAFPSGLEDLAHLGHGCRHCGQLFERRSRRPCNHSRERGLSGSGRPVEDRRADAGLLDRKPESGVLAEHLLLSDELLEPLRPHPHSERSRLRQALVCRVREQVSHSTEVCFSTHRARDRGGSMAFEELKSKQSVMWGNGPYQNITETLVDIHDLLVDRLEP